MNDQAPATEAGHVGTVGVIGRPSTGKSTLINRICGHKVSIVSPVPQTTRTRVRGILTRGRDQLIFLDTPGLHHSERKLNRVLRETALGVAAEVDLLLLVFDAARRFGAEDRAVIAAAGSFSGPRVAVRNKVDLPVVDEGLPEALRGAGIGRELSTSAAAGDGVDQLVAQLLALSPRGELLYPADMYTDQSPDFRVAEIVREKTIARARAEVPHAVYVQVLDLEPRSDGLWARATILVERPSQVGIVVGHRGSGIEQIRRGAEAELSEIFGRRVLLSLRVKVRKNWRQDDTLLAALRRQG